MQLLKELTKEYISKGGRVTCEVSVGLITPALALQLLDLNKDIAHLDSEWVIRPCETCLEHNSDKPLHLEIDKVRCINVFNR